MTCHHITWPSLLYLHREQHTDGQRGTLSLSQPEDPVGEDLLLAAALLHRTLRLPHTQAKCPARRRIEERRGEERRGEERREVCRMMEESRDLRLVLLLCFNQTGSICSLTLTLTLILTLILNLMAPWVLVVEATLPVVAVIGKGRER
jgi:hypothetical protein